MGRISCFTAMAPGRRESEEKVNLLFQNEMERKI